MTETSASCPLLTMSLKYALAAVTAVSLTNLTAPAQAALVNIPLTFNFAFGDSTTSSGTGFVTIDDSNLAPNVLLGGPNDLSGLEGFSATFTDLSSTPSTTTFGLSDLDSWSYRTDGAGDFLDINFFMNEGSTNGDGYRLNGVDPFASELSGNGQSTFYLITPGEPVPASTPEPTTLMGLLLIGGAGLLAKRKKSI
ncbi:MAG: PEP-CTERM sorting domain-containing protein [Crocosphaera sp.]